ncbi:ribbon-helix-helix domain-containing protein [Saccharolobus sp.]|uniref:ribbon-helix-helix domain-containing protein n=1 Tax=Saccharolobus sp. TaxID=2100761 RepID=UPI00317495C9
MRKVVKLDDKTFILEEERSLVITFKLEEENLIIIDELLNELGFSSRSDLIRKAIIEFIEYLSNPV